jgi:hypothetical protein
MITRTLACEGAGEFISGQGGRRLAPTGRGLSDRGLFFCGDLGKKLVPDRKKSLTYVGRLCQDGWVGPAFADRASYPPRGGGAKSVTKAGVNPGMSPTPSGRSGREGETAVTTNSPRHGGRGVSLPLRPRTHIDRPAYLRPQKYVGRPSHFRPLASFAILVLVLISGPATSCASLP